MASWILRVFRTRNTFPMLILLKTVLIPVVEYACVLWLPNEAGLIQMLEKIQKHFTSKFNEFTEYDTTLGLKVCTTDYWERLKALKIFSLERRRERYMILFL